MIHIEVLLYRMYIISSLIKYQLDVSRQSSYVNGQIRQVVEMIQMTRDEMQP